MFMQLHYQTNGRQFFFVTIAVEGRRPLLSRLVDDSPRPSLLPIGEAVVAALRSLHVLFPAVTVSDRVLMPDHLHFVLIIDYARLAPSERGLSPLWLCHRVIDAVELWVTRTGAEPTRTGDSSPAPPDKEELATLFRLARGWEASAFRVGGAGARAPELAGLPRLFERSPWVDLSFDSRQLKAIRHYIRLNPARALWKARHPDRFICHRGLSAARLARFAPRRFDGLGNLPLLGSPFLKHLRLTLKKPLAEHRTAIDEIVELAQRGVVIVSGFISPGEIEALKRLKAEPRTRFIRLLPYALPARYDPSAEDSREIAAGRMAILSGFPETPPISRREMRENPAAAHQFRANCLAMNELGAALCDL